MEDEPRERIAKALSRAGVASRREAERMIEAGRVRLNGRPVDTPATTVTESDRIEVDGRPVGAPDAARLWLHHKPAGLVTTASDERGRPTVFDRLPQDMPRVMSVGRLDLSSEGLLLLTNDGGLKRRLELPSTGWLRRYRVRVHGAPSEEALEPLRRGLTLGGERFQPMTVGVDRQQGANAWLTVALREGRNREIRRAMEAVGLRVNRLIRVSYGPFQLGSLTPGAVEEVRQKVLRDQLGSGPATKGRDARPAGGSKARAPGPAKAGQAAKAGRAAKGAASEAGGPKAGAAPGPPGGRRASARGPEKGAGPKAEGSPRARAGRPPPGRPSRNPRPGRGGGAGRRG